jgi:hypothetical protein
MLEEVSLDIGQIRGRNTIEWIREYPFQIKLNEKLK